MYALNAYDGPVAEELIGKWRTCQQRLTELERQYAAAMVAYSRGEGPFPPEELRTELLALRKEVQRLLADALAAIDRHLGDMDRKLRKP